MIIAFHCIDSSRYFVGATAIRVSSLDFEGFLFWRVAFFSVSSTCTIARAFSIARLKAAILLAYASITYAPGLLFNPVHLDGAQFSLADKGHSCPLKGRLH